MTKNIFPSIWASANESGHKRIVCKKSLANKTMSSLARAQKVDRMRNACYAYRNFKRIIVSLYLIQISSNHHLNSISVDCHHIKPKTNLIKWYPITATSHNLPIPLGYYKSNNHNRRHDTDASNLITTKKLSKISFHTDAAKTILANKMSQSLTDKYGHMSRKSEDAIRNHLPNGPPPYRPSQLMIGLGNAAGNDIFQRTFRRMHKSKAYYLFLDMLRQLTVFVDAASKKKLDLTSAKLGTIKALVHKLAWKGGDAMKLNWPLILLNPLFVKEILSSPTLLVMLFHAVEVAYMSSPLKFWLKPLLRLVVQPSPEKEEKIWWRRKRLYDVLNGHGSSELQPNLRTIHFRQPGRPTPIAIPSLVNFARQLAGGRLPISGQSSQNFPSSSSQQQAFIISNPTKLNKFPTDQSHGHTGEYSSLDQQNSNTQEDYQVRQPHAVAEETPPVVFDSTNIRPELLVDNEDWLTTQLNSNQLMSQKEFDSLDLKTKELVLREFNRYLDESRWTNELIQEQSDLVESFNRRESLPTKLI